MKMTNVENEMEGDSGGTKVNKIAGSNSTQLNPSLIKILSTNNSSSPIPMMKSSSLTSVTTATTSSIISSTIATSQIINNSESEINKNDISNTSQMKYDTNYNITGGINKATQFCNSPIHSSRSNSTTSLTEYYSSSPIPTPKVRLMAKSNTIPLPSYSYNSNLNSSNSSNPYEEYLNEYGFFYTEEELNAYKSVTNFICKIAQLILRSRVGLSYNHNYYPSLNKKSQPKDSNNNQLDSITNSLANMNIKNSYASSISSIDSQTHSIPYSMSINSSYTSSFENPYRPDPNGIYSSISTYNSRINDIFIPTPSIDNIKQLHGLLLDRMQFWKNCIPINIDIFASNNGNTNSYSKMGNDDYRRKSNDYSHNIDIEKEHDINFNTLYERKNNESSISTRTRSSSISNIYPPKASTSSSTSTTKFNNKRLLERWVVSYEPNNDKEKMNKSRNSKVDTTDLILLVQSLYSYIRLMPLHSLLSDKSIKKSDLQYCISTADGYLLLPLFEGENNDIEFCDVGSSGFDLSAKLKVYKFTKASTTLGNLHISVVYDANINNNNPSTNVSYSLSKPLSTTSSSYNFIDPNQNSKIIGTSSKISNNSNNNTFSKNSDIQSKSNILNDENIEKSSLPNETKENLINNTLDKKTDTPTDDDNCSPTNKRKTVKTIGSPFPSPKTHTKVLSLTQNKYSFQPQSSQLSTSTPNLIHQLMNKQRFEKYGSSVHSLSDNNSLSSQSNLLLSGFNYKKSSINENNKNDSNKQHQLNSINIPNNSMLSLNNKKSNNNIKYLNTPNSLNSNSNNNDSQNNSMELFGSLVGSYEESILSGRMSTLPSKPIKFISEIGVIGFGKCHPRLKCPPHINITFPVYFYEIPDQNDFFTTPYVGTVDIEQFLQKQNLLKKQKQEQQQKEQQQKQQKLINEPEEVENLNTEIKNDSTKTKNDNEDMNSKEKNINTTSIPTAILLNDEPIVQRTSSSSSLNGMSSKFPGYRIPFKGQIQVIIKNPSKTAVKVFLIPYDFHDMPPGTKTFIRQKSYLKNTSNNKNSLDQKCSLRYAIHLQFISPSKKRLYLYKSLRVVFAHKAPEKDEKLYTISDGPVDPKYISIVDNNSRNYSHSSKELNNEKFFGTDLGIKSEGKSLSSKDENDFLSSSYSSRRRSSFGSNVMMLAEMGVNLGDYSVSPVKPMIYQYPYTLQQKQHHHTPSTSGIGMNTKITNPLYFGGNNIHHNLDNNSLSHDSIQFSIPSSSKRIQPQSYRYLSQNLDDDMSSKLPPKGTERIKNTNFNITSSNYSSGGLTKSVIDTNDNFYSKSSSKHISIISNLNNKSSIGNLNKTNLESEINEASSSTLSSNFKVFNYIN